MSDEEKENSVSVNIEDQLGYSTEEDETLVIPRVSRGGKYTLIPVYCNGAIRPRWFSTATDLTERYAEFVLDGLNGVNQQKIMVYQPYHVQLVAAVFRNNTGLVAHKIVSEKFRCAHDVDRDDPFLSHVIAILQEVAYEEDV